MFHGRVGAALRVLSTTPSKPLEITEEVIAQLKSKHPDGKEISTEHLYSTDPAPKPDPIVFYDISAKSIRDAAGTTKGGAGPSGTTDRLWARMICSKSFSKEADALAHAIALMTRRLCTVHVDPTTISPLLACRLKLFNTTLNKLI